MFHVPPSVFNDPEEPWLKAAAESINEGRLHDLWVDSRGSLRVTLCCPPLLYCAGRAEVPSGLIRSLDIMQRFLEGQLSWTSGCIPVWFIDLPLAKETVDFASLAQRITLYPALMKNEEIKQRVVKTVQTQAALDLTKPELKLNAGEREYLNRVIMLVAQQGYDRQAVRLQRDQFDRQMQVGITSRVANRWVQTHGYVPSVPDLEHAVRNHLERSQGGKSAAVGDLFIKRMTLATTD